MPLFDNLKLATSQFIPTYAGTPLQELEKTGNVLQDRYYQNLANQNQIELALEQQPYLPGDEHIRETLREDLKSAIKSIADTGGDYENATQKVTALSKAFITDPRRLQADRNYQSIQQEIQKENEMRAKGITPLRSSKRENFSTINPSTGELGLFQSDLQAQLDYDKRRQSLFDNIKADVGPLSVKNLNEDEKKALVGYLKTGQWAGVSKGKIKRYLDEAFNRYQTTPEYQQQKYFGASDQEIVNQLLSTGLERVFTQSKDDLIRDLSLTENGKAKGNAPYAYTEDGSVELDQRFPDPNDFVTKQRSSAVQFEVPDLEGTFPDPEGTRRFNIGRSPNLTPEDKNLFKLVTDQIVGVDAPNEAKEKAYADYVEKHGQKNVAPNILIGDFLRQDEPGRSTREDASKDANANFRNLLFWDIEEGQVVRGNDPEFWEDHLKEKQDEIEVTGFYDSKNNFPTITGNPNFGVGMAVKIRGTNKQYIMTRSTSDYKESPKIKRELLVNQLYDRASTLPDLWAPIILRGIPTEIKQTLNPTGQPSSYSIKLGEDIITAPTVHQTLDQFIDFYRKTKLSKTK